MCSLLELSQQLPKAQRAAALRCPTAPQVLLPQNCCPQPRGRRLTRREARVPITPATRRLLTEVAARPAARRLLPPAVCYADNTQLISTIPPTPFTSILLENRLQLPLL